MKICDLSDILKFQNHHIVDRYCKDFKLPQETGNEFFLDMLRFLWITKKNQLEKKCHTNLDSFVVMHQEMIDIDNMWHTFILFTKEYTDFCYKYFGHYMHHAPATQDTPKLTVTEFEKQFRVFLSYVYDNLGEDVLCRWFSKYCKI